MASNNESFKIFLLSSMILSIVCFLCLGDTSEQLEQAKDQIFSLKEKIVSLIHVRSYEAAETSIAQIKVDFDGDPCLPLCLYEIGYKYANVGDTDSFSSMCEQIVSDFPQSPVVTKAQIYLSRFAVEDMIENGYKAGAEAAIAQMKSDFAGDPELPWQLYEIAHKYNQSGAMTHFLSQCEQIVSQYPQSTASFHARLYLSRFDIEDLIDQGNHSAADIAIEQMKSDFAGHNSLSRRVYEIAYKFGQIGDIARFRSMCREIADDFPGTDAASDSQLYLSRFAVEDMIDQVDHAAVEAAIAQMKTDFAGHIELPWRLYEIAHKYNQPGTMTHFWSQCEQIVSQYPQSTASSHARLYLARHSIEELIAQGNYSAAEAAISQMKSNFSGIPDLPWQLCEIAYKCGQLSDFETATSLAKALYQEVVRDYAPPRELEVACRARLAAYDISDLIKTGDTVAADAGISQVKAQFADAKEKALAAYVVAEMLSEKAMKFDPDQVSLTSEYLSRSISLYENDFLGQTNRNDIISEAYLILGANYGRMNDDAKSIEYYQKLVDTFPKHRLAWHCQFMVGRCYEKLLRYGQISEMQANSQIQLAYTTLLEKYPDCKAKAIAGKWLVKNSM